MLSLLNAVVLLAGGYSFYYLVKEGERYIMQPTKVKMFPLNDEHANVFGRTRYGKTWATIKTMARSKKGVFFFNTQHTEIGYEDGFVIATGDDDINLIIELLKDGRKINFMPSTDLGKAEKQLKAVVDSFYNAGEIDMRVVLDEVHLLKKDGLEACRRIATAGLRYGYKGVFISQRPANMHNDLISQATKHIYFHISPQDQEYLSKFSIPVEDMMGCINNKKYVFAVYDEETVKGGFKIGK